MVRYRTFQLRFVCAIWVTAALKAATHKGLLAVVGNGLLSSAMLAPLAFLTVETGRASDTGSAALTATGTVTFDSSRPRFSRQQLSSASLSVKFLDLSALRKNLRLTLLVAILTGLNRTLTDCTLYFIDAWLKTALLALSVPLTYVFGAMVPGVDESAKEVLFACLCNRRRNADPRRWRSAVAVIPALLLISVGGIVTALPNSDHGSRAHSGETGPTLSGKNQWTYLFGITLQMLSNCAGAAQNVYTKVLLSPKLSNQPAGGRPESVVSKAQNRFGDPTSDWDYGAFLGCVLRKW